MNILNEILKDKKKMIIIISLIAIIFVVTIILCLKVYKKEVISITDNVEYEKFKNEYESLNQEVTTDGKKYPKVELPANNKIKYSNISEILNIFETRGDAVIYFGSPTCLYCRNAIQVLCDVASETELQHIYYLDVDKTDEKYNELLKVLGEKFTIDKKGEELYIPLVAFVASGNVVSYNKGSSASQDDPYEPLSESQIKGLTFIYKSGINDVLDSIRVKSNVISDNNAT